MRTASTGSDAQLIRFTNRADLLLLQDDPNYLPELALANLTRDFNLLDADLIAGSSSDRSRLHSPHDSLSSRTSLDSIPGIRVPSSDSGGLGGDFGGLGGFSFGGDDTSQAGRLSQLASGGLRQIREDDGFLPPPDFDFDIHGNIVDMNAPAAAETGEARGRPVEPSDASAIERVRREHEDARLAQPQVDSSDHLYQQLANLTSAPSV